MTPYFLPVADGFRFCVYHEAQTHPARGAVLYIHPFAEEMNKSRRMAARQARLLASSGFCVLQMDLLGCGDSSGVFEDATWDLWLKDVLYACDHLRSRSQAPSRFGDYVLDAYLRLRQRLRYRNQLISFFGNLSCQGNSIGSNSCA